MQGLEVVARHPITEVSKIPDLMQFVQNAELKKVQNISRQWITAGILWLSTKGKPELLLPRTRFADTVDKNPGTRKISGGSKSKTEQDQWIDSEKKQLAAEIAIQAEHPCQHQSSSVLLGLIVMVLYKLRTWCTFCPIGTMTQGICKLKNNENK